LRNLLMDSGRRREMFEAEVMPHLHAAYRLAHALTRRDQDAEDLVQDACLRAYAGFNGYEPGTNARAWLLTIVRNTHLNNVRRSQVRPVQVPLESGTSAEPADTRTPGPEDEALRRLDRADVLSAVAKLPESYRAVLSLVDLSGLRYAEAAAVLGCPSGTVMSRLYRARLRLANLLEDSAVMDTGTARRVGRRARQG
jgi:RNA polymerase sigma-70 factor, ECF subfamily